MVIMEPLKESILQARHRLGSLSLVLDMVVRLPDNDKTRHLLGEAIRETAQVLDDLRQRVAVSDE
jgi:hypothetical protein